MTKTEAKKEAKNIIGELLATAYYRLENMEFTEEEEEVIHEELGKITTSLFKKLNINEYYL